MVGGRASLRVHYLSTFPFPLSNLSSELMTLERTSPLRALVRDVVEKTPVFDIHTHLYDRRLWRTSSLGYR